MNVAFFLTPKSEVIHEKVNSTMRRAMERMEYHRYTAIPLVDEKGRYVGTLTEGDILWKFKNDPNITLKDTEKVLIKDIPRNVRNKAVSINSDIESLILVAKSQNFVPVVDDSNIFIGIIKRSDIISYCYNRIFNEDKFKNLPTYEILEEIAN
ncbi:CBS domain protein [Clostridium argentinense CDC 2741]|uniref:CBS domain protein n=1 Tax=Clostridium argentinense CDC 2741 TaxID=1418104 RepID=A0A0C1R3R9_9CLOT|nr:CBS domain-containing protein [Clostridium argentinense]ARC84854.1 CBS domain-containing protein [Clostridium argentinense]KIE48197.1 CBS domain protein [Clostridium argentinense CDC 2741]NFF41779.1 CBS domain-containing protein [Clostridium argentinense]NFP51612.1 CBS domain-containing protein [Clostridium argentinense]NFP74813.1 CBS domain-containing protein [Clostridium argentinense]